MKLKVEDFDIDVFRQTKPSKWLRRCGWFWQECRLPPNGPFSSIGDALRHLTAKVESGELRTAVDAKAAMRRRRKE